MSKQRTEAEALAVSLELGLRGVADAVTWADNQIAAEASVPHIALCELALAHHEHGIDVANLLRRLPGAVDQQEVTRRVVRDTAEAARTQRLTPRMIESALFTLALNSELPPGEVTSAAYQFSHDLDLAEEGLSHDTPAHVMKRMLKVLDWWLEQQSAA